MKPLSRHALAQWLSARGIDRQSMTWSDAPSSHRLLVREGGDPEAVEGPHRRVRLPGEGVTLKIRLGDRPCLTGLVARILDEAGCAQVCAFGPPESYWLNNRGYAAYLSKVEDSRRIHRFLRRAGVSDRFRGGFVILPHEFESHVPQLAAQPFCGGPDVLFASCTPALLILACHEFDLHVEARDSGVADVAERLAAEAGLNVLRGAVVDTGLE